MLVSQAHSVSQQARLAVTLAWVAGYTNILTLVTCGTVTSHVSGHVSQWGSDLFKAAWGPLGFLSFLLGAFGLGAAASALCIEHGKRRGWESIYVLPMAVQAALLGAFAVGVELHDHRFIETGLMLYAMTGVASFAMGLQNATITRISGGVVRTTHMTGVLTDLGHDFAVLLYHARDIVRARRAHGGRAVLAALLDHALAARVMLLACILVSFAVGAGLGVTAYGFAPSYAMYPPVLFLLWIIVQDIRTPICALEESGLADELGMQLPPSIAVFHLRRKVMGTRRRHRMPDLVRWIDALPRDKRIVVLNLEEAEELDPASRIELRALLHRAAGAGRVVLIAGLSQAMVREFGGADGRIDPSIFCPDLELAIARALTLAEARAGHRF